MELILVRHGQTDYNATGRYQGQGDYPLNAVGRRQAQLVARHLAVRPPAAIFCSDLSRARESALPLAQRCGLAVVEDRRLRELDFGAWEGLTCEQIIARWGDCYRSWIDNPEGCSPPYGESLGQLRERVFAFVYELADGACGGPAALFTHGGVIRALISALQGKAFWQIKLTNGAISRLRRHGGGWTVVTVNETDHLHRKI